MQTPRIKKLYQYVLQNFLPLFCMTFFICLFIVLMQFLWRYIDNLVGKGLGVGVIGELFFYAALTMVPMALPLAVLLASLMTFGNLGERLELTAMKSAGVSLLRTMLPLMWFMGAVAVGAFFFQNNVLPVAQTKMWTLLYSMRQKSPELEIPEGIFYDQIPGYNIFVQQKDPDTGILRGVMIYDLSRGFDNAMVMLADSGRLAVTPDKTHLQLQLWEGESFENLKDAATRGLNNVPYRREKFADKQIVMQFDANFNRLDEEGMRNQYVGKDITRLRATIDSLGRRNDSVAMAFAADVAREPLMGIRQPGRSPRTLSESESAPDELLAETRRREEAAARAAAMVDVDSVFARGTASWHAPWLQSALTRTKRKRQEADYRAAALQEDLKTVRRHAIELQRKFTLSFACIVFFFIGAPLGAIIRKGGLGVPIVISVILFIFYYIIDNIGYKMAREGRIDVWQGMWLSSAVLLPLGVVLTWKAVNDSAVFNPDAWLALVRRLTPGRRARAIEHKEVILEPSDPAACRRALDLFADDARRWLASPQAAMPGYAAWWRGAFSSAAVVSLSAALEKAVGLLADCPDKEVAARINDFPMLPSPRLLGSPLGKAASLKALRIAAMTLLVPLALPLWLVARHRLARLRADTGQALSNARIVLSTLAHDDETPQESETTETHTP